MATPTPFPADNPAAPPIAAHVEAFTRDGFTLLPRAHPDAWVQALRVQVPALWRSQHSPMGEPPGLFSQLVETAPALAVEAIQRPLVLDLVEALIGPQVQLESMTIVVSPAAPPVAALPGVPSGWHRDLFAPFPSHDGYQPPLLLNAITYLQDLTPATGPLRVLPGTHRRPSTVDPSQRLKPQPGELLLYPRAGDVVVFHHGLLHSGTIHHGTGWRMFCCVTYQLCWLKHRDDYDGPACRQLIRDARQRGDRRLLRLLDADERAMPRVLHDPVLEPRTTVHAQWQAEDDHLRQHLVAALAPGDAN